MFLFCRRTFAKLLKISYESFKFTLLTVLVLLISAIYLSILYLSSSTPFLSSEQFDLDTTPVQHLVINNDENLEVGLSIPQFRVKSKPKRNPSPFERPTNAPLSTSTHPAQVQIPVNSKCPIMNHYEPDFDSTLVFQNLTFNDSSIWDETLETRYLTSTSKFPLKVIILPHSHNDPGWGWTFDDYYTMWTKDILNLMIEKLVEHKNMTFIWSEVSFLQLWWKTAPERSKELFKALVHEGRLELTTGGWVMTDEAVVHLYSMISQLIEGQEWIKYNVGVLPESAWSVDPFGFGSVMPYILKSSQIDSMVILRIHYAWKKWLAHRQYGDFCWGQRWDNAKDNSILCHHHPFTIYTMTRSLGPNYHQNYLFNFINSDVVQVHSGNVQQYSKSFIEEAGRTGSLSPHNVVLAILGDDFRFRNASEWDDSYSSFMQIFQEINSNSGLYKNAEVGFGTVRDYFKSVRERQNEDKFPIFNGDFFVYSDEITDENGRGAYWSGFYSTRPYWKQLFREAEANLRAAEILLTFARIEGDDAQPGDIPKGGNCDFKNMAKLIYKRLQIARRHVALFAHHDGAPGVSTQFVMRDYGFKLNEALIHTTNVQIACLTCLLQLQNDKQYEIRSSLTFPSFQASRVLNPLNFSGKGQNMEDDDELEQYEKILLVYNSLGWSKFYAISVVVTNPSVQVLGPYGEIIQSQLNPLLTKNQKSRVVIARKKFELVFYYKLEAISVTKFRIIAAKSGLPIKSIAVKGKIYYRTFNMTSIGNIDFETAEMDKDHEPTISNQKYKLHFDPATGFLQRAYLLQPSQNQNPHEMNLKLKFGGYSSVPTHSGPYLFLPKDEFDDHAYDDFAFRRRQSEDRTILLIDGPLESKVHVVTSALVHTVKLCNVPSESVPSPSSASELNNGIFIRNIVHVGEANGEYFMRFDTSLDNRDPLRNSTVFYTDQSGFTFEKRTTVESIGLEGNYYPITTIAYIQDHNDGTGQDKYRLSLLVDRAHGVSSFYEGRLEVMIERRVKDDDNRGIGQGVLDNRPTTSNYVLRLENIGDDFGGDGFQSSLPTLETHHASQQLNYPLLMYFVNKKADYDEQENLPNNFWTFSQLSFLKQNLPSDTHLLLLRTQPSSADLSSPSDTSLMTLQKFGYSCHPHNGIFLESNASYSNPTSFFHNSETDNGQVEFLNTISKVSVQKGDLTGLKNPKTSSENIFEAQPFQISSFLLQFHDSKND